MTISAIVAVSHNGIIGVNGKIPWKLPEDMKRFKQLTMGHHLIMGRATYESIGRPLPGRTTIVLSRGRSGLSKEYPKGVVLAGSLNEALTMLENDDDEAFICGGAQVYNEAMSLCNRMYLTVIERDFEGDTRFDYNPLSEHGRVWRQVVGERSNFEGMSYRFETWER